MPSVNENQMKLVHLTPSNNSAIIVGVSRGYTDYYQGQGHSIRPTATVINFHEHLI